jgi:cholesterol oxidase
LNADGSVDFEVVVVGSGFGGSVSAFRYADAGRRVLLLERGRAYPPGSFARTPHELSRNFWDPSEGLHGLFNVWSFSRLAAIVSSGLGGGSLIYANVELRKDPKWFVHGERHGDEVEEWPVSYEELKPHYKAVERMLGVQTFPSEAYAGDVPKTAEYLQAAERAGLDAFLPNLAVTFSNRGRPPMPGEPIDGGSTDNYHRRPRETCRLVGECNLGCNFGSKNSLDWNYISAAQRAGAEIKPLCEVKTFAPREGGDGFVVQYVDRSGPAEAVVSVTTKRLVLSAGTFGTNFLLLTNRRSFPLLSSRLGHGFSGNGDILTFVSKATRQVAGRAEPRVLDASKGPVITSTVRVPDAADGGDGPGFYIQDAGYPAFVSWLVQAADARADVSGLLHVARDVVGRWLRHERRPDVGSELATLLSDTRLASDSMPLLGMGRDIPDGRFFLDDAGQLELDWRIDASLPYFERVRRTARRLADTLGGELRDEPLWALSRTITVHPLGGCAIGTRSDDGVIDSYGRVFNYPGLSIADGSVLPGPVGPNPSLTIAALADRFAQRVLEEEA